MSVKRHAAAAVPWGVVLAACLILAITFGSTMTRGLFLSPLNSSTGLGIVTLSFAMAVAQLMWGAWQPVFGALADRYGPAVVIFG
jgi:MFS family permease